MIPLTLAEVAEAAGGTLHGADAAARVTGITTDSRAVRPGDLFVALKGEHVDGARFAAAATAAGGWEPADVVLVKASRAVGLERAVQALVEGGGA